jgi:F0F1-type ATP synthase assembly protein I
LFVVNAVPQLQPWASVVLILVGLACLVLSLRRSKQRVR